MKSGRGGVRENAGRKTSWISGRGFDRTKIIRVPVEFADQLLAVAHRLDAGENLDLVTNSEDFSLEPTSVEELVTESLERALFGLVAKSKPELDLVLEEKELVTESKEQVIIDLVKDALVKWRRKSDEAKITSPKSERWVNARKMLSELESIVFGAAPLSEKSKSQVIVTGAEPIVEQVSLVTKSNPKNTEALDSVAFSQNELVSKPIIPHANDLETNSNVTNTNPLELVTETELPILDKDVIESSNQLNLLNHSKYQTDDSNHETKELASLTRTELAERFGISIDTLKNRITGKMASSFFEWSRKKDPDGIAWQYYPETKLFFPLVENVTNSEIKIKVDEAPLDEWSNF